MEPREIDVLVAEKVFDGKQPAAWGVECWADGTYRYSTDIKAAMEVVGHWKARPGDMTLRCQNGHWHCEFSEPSSEWSAWARTAPMAIALAALRSVGVEVE